MSSVKDRARVAGGLSPVGGHVGAAVRTNASTGGPGDAWQPLSWDGRPTAQPLAYPDAAAVDAAVSRLRQLPPLVTSGEIVRLKTLIAEAQEGKRFLLQGGDCAESIDECRPEVITAQLKILLQMSLVLVHGMKKPVIRLGRFAGQYAKPRSKAVEAQDGVELPSYFGDIVNRAPFTAEARTPNPRNMVDCYHHAAMTLNFIRSLLDGGFADLHHPEHWDLRFVHHADLPPDLKSEYETMTRSLAEALRFMEALGDKSVDELSGVEFFTSHEGLNLLYESAQTRMVPRKAGWWNLTTHLPWIGERTRNLDGPHVEYFRGIENPVGVKVGPATTPDEVMATIDALNPDDSAGKLVLIHRMGARKVAVSLPPLLERVKAEGRRVLWVCDPMHGNTRSAGDGSGVKTRDFDDILAELETAMDCHAAAGTVLGGVHFELTGDDVTECVGGGIGVTEADLAENYQSACDPRLNYQQALEMAFLLARRTNGE